MAANTGGMVKEVLCEVFRVRYIWLHALNVPLPRTVLPVVYFIGFSAQAGLPLASTL